MTDKKEVEELAKLIKDFDEVRDMTYEEFAKRILEEGYTKSKLVELDKLQVKELLDKFISCATNREEIAQVLCSRFGTKKVDVGRIEEILKQYIFDEKDGHHSVKCGLATAIVNALKELEG